MNRNESKWIEMKLNRAQISIFSFFEVAGLKKSIYLPGCRWRWAAKSWCSRWCGRRCAWGGRDRPSLGSTGGRCGWGAGCRLTSSCRCRRRRRRRRLAGSSRRWGDGGGWALPVRARPGALDTRSCDGCRCGCGPSLNKWVNVKAGQSSICCGGAIPQCIVFLLFYIN